MKNQAITYYRVSTTRQGISGLSLEAQTASVRAFAKANGFYISNEFTEVESGRKNNRPILEQALDACAKADGTLLIAKLDRLSRNVAFVSRLMESGVEFKAVDNPHASKLLVHVMAAFAEQERDTISERTTIALQKARERGTKLGTYGRNVLSKLNHLRSIKFAGKMKPVIAALQSCGITTVRSIANALNRLHVPTYRNKGTRWHPSSVHKLIKLINNQ